MQPPPAKRAKTVRQQRELDTAVCAANSNADLQRLLECLEEDYNAAATRRSREQEAQQEHDAERQRTRSLVGQIHDLLHERERGELEHKVRMDAEARRQQGIESAHAATIQELQERHAQQMKAL